MIIIKWNWLRLIGSNLALLLIAQLIAAIPRDGNLFEEIFAQDPPQSYLGFNIPVEFDQGDEVSWDQQLRGININVICNRRDNFENKFRFFQDLKRKQELLKNDPGRQYVLNPQRSFTLRGKRCFVTPHPYDGTADLHTESYLSLDRNKLSLSFFIKAIRGINYIHKIGWTNIDINAFNVVVRSNSDINPIINVMEIEQLRRIEFRNNAVLLIDPPQPDLLYSPEWIENIKMDPRTVDLWKVGETVYAAQYGLYPLKEKMYLEPIVNNIFSKMPDVQPELGNTQEQFRRFMAHFNKFIKENYKSGLTTTNNDRAVVLNTSGGIIGHSIGASSSPLKQISLTPEIMNLLIVAQHKVFGNNDFQIYSKFLLNGFFRLGIYCRVSSKHIRSLNLYAPIFDMLNKLLAINPKERLTPNQYLEQIDRNANANRLHASV